MSVSKENGDECTCECSGPQETKPPEENPCVCEYLKQRKALIKQDRRYSTGFKLKLTDREKAANAYLMKHKGDEMSRAFSKPQQFPPANHFFKLKKCIDKSKVFQFLKLMPKGASLHAHDTGMVSGDFLYSLTFKDNLYGRIRDCAIEFQFFLPKRVPKDEEWTSLKELRESDPGFDEFLKCRLSLIRPNPEAAFPDIDSVWKTFQNLFINLEKLITFKPVFQEYFYQTLKEAYEENVKYVEFRGYLPQVYELDGTIYKDDQVVELYWETLTQFMCDYPDFVGCQFIFAPHRKVDREGMDAYIKVFKKIKKLYPRFVAGFDLVGQEDKGPPLIYFLDQLLELQEDGAKFFFHAGETHWNGQPTDLNILDAILLNTVRIGHGFGILKHPLAVKMIQEKKIAVEVAPISNQVLKLCDDLRNHPGAIMIANDYPMVIVSDDPCFWGAKGISYDWYMVFMGMCHREADLKFLKTMALNSIKYSALDDEQKDIAKKQFDCDWNRFILKVLKGCECGQPKDC